jgi:hypothetical protein
MKRQFAKTLLAVAVAVAYAGAACAAVTPEEAKQLGDNLLPWGAEKAGNKEGTIPAWSGPPKPPANFDPNNPAYRPDPFASEKPLFSINARNMAQHADKLSEGAKTMMQKYPTFRIDVYPSHRVVNNTRLFNDNAIKNATVCKTTDGGLKLEGCWAGTPFPIPKTGAEVMWNRLLKYDGHSLMSKHIVSWIVDVNGNFSTGGESDFYMTYPIFDPKKTTPIASNEYYEKLRLDFSGPARKSGEKLMVHDNIDMVSIGRRAWQYLPGQRRVKLMPDLSYDTPTPTGGGAATTDDGAIFFGAIDRYDWKLLGKREMYIPYNNYKARDPNICSSKVIIQKSHLNPDCMRWELHRVWVVEGTVKQGLRHLYARRVIYWDEDMPGVGMADNYDAADQLYRVSFSLPLSFYEAYGGQTDEWVTYDLLSGAYTYQETATDRGGWIITPPKPDSFFSPEALVGEGVR